MSSAPTAEQIPALPSSPAGARPRVTDIVSRIHATGLAVTTAGALVALHLATPQGIVVVTMDRPTFAAARAERDHHGMPFEQSKVETRKRGNADTENSECGRLESEGKNTPIAEITCRQSIPHRERPSSPEYQARRTAAVREVLAGKGEIKAIAARYRLNYGTLLLALKKARAEIAEHGPREA